MDKTSTPIIYQYTHWDDKSKSELIDIFSLIKKEKWLIEQFKEFEKDIPEIPEKLIDKILAKANIY